MDSKRRSTRRNPPQTVPAPPAHFHAVTDTLTPTVTHVRARSTPHALLSPKINGRDEGRLGYADLLGSLDKLVYVTCSSTTIIYPPATAELYWGVDSAGAPKLIDSLVIAAEADNVTFAVPGALLAGTADPTSHRYTGDGEHNVFVRLHYEGSHDDSPEATVTVKCSEPGGPDPVGATRDINENLPKPTITPSPVPDATTPVWIIVEGYDVREIGDRITFEWGGPRNAFAQVVGSDSGAISAQVPPEIIARVGGGKIPVSYYITDAVGNWSKYAPYADPDVDIDPGTLVAPQLLYINGTAVSGVLDLDTVGSDSVIVRVAVRSLYEGDVVNAWWEATLPDGTVEKYASDDLLFDDEDSQFYLDALIDNPTAREAAGGTVKIWYVIKGSGAISKRRTYKVSELPDRVLLAPTVPQSDGVSLDPTGLSYITVNAPFDPAQMAQGDTVTMIVIGTRGTGSTYWSDTRQLSSGDLRDPIPFYCPAKILQDVENGEATFHYELASPRAVAADGATIYATPRESAKLTLRIRQAGASDLPPPIVKNVKDGVLDPDLPQTTVEIPNSAATMPGTQVTLNWEGLVSYTTTGTVPSTGLLAFTITMPYIDGNRDRTVTVTYEINKITSEAVAVFIGQPKLDLPAPTVDEAAANILDPAAVPPGGITVRIPVPLEPTDLVTATFGSYTTTGKAGASGLFFTIPPGEVAKTLGSEVTVFYTVLRGGKRHDSAPLSLHVLGLGDNDSRLPTPAIDKASGNTLDLGSFTGDPRATVAPWPVIAEGQTVWLKVTGTLANNSPTTIVLLNGVSVTTAMVKNGLSQAIPRARLEALKDRSDITVECKVNFSGGNEAGAVTFPHQSYQIKHAVPEFILDRSQMNLVVGNNATRTPTGGTPPYGYASNNTGVATVNTAGTVSARAAGTAIITVSDSTTPQKNTGTYPVQVTAPFYLDKSEMHLDVNGNQTRTPTGGRTPYSYTSNNTSVATVDSSGRVTGRAAGSATITVTDSSSPQNRGAYSVTVKPTDVTETFDTMPHRWLGVGEEFQLPHCKLIARPDWNLGGRIEAAAQTELPWFTGTVLRGTVSQVEIKPNKPCMGFRVGIWSNVTFNWNTYDAAGQHIDGSTEYQPKKWLEVRSSRPIATIWLGVVTGGNSAVTIDNLTMMY